VIHAGVGKASFDEAQLADNVRAFVNAISRARPSGTKGTFIKRLSVSSTMGPSVKIDVSSVNAGA
jgi:large subunit ribosomal protein L1